jgi:hypothetical protein
LHAESRIDEAATKKAKLLVFILFFLS